MQQLTPEQQQKIQEDLADRERQASALAAAGMVAESVSLTTPAVQGLQAPPPLGGVALLSSYGSGSNPPLASIDWNMEMDGGDVGGQGLDDLDMDFATLFDTESEINMMIKDGHSTESTTAPLTCIGAPTVSSSTNGPVTISAETPNPLNGNNTT
jgi:hypothetical protein